MPEIEVWRCFCKMGADLGGFSIIFLFLNIIKHVSILRITKKSIFLECK